MNAGKEFLKPYGTYIGRLQNHTGKRYTSWNSHVASPASKPSLGPARIDIWALQTFAKVPEVAGSFHNQGW
jgi:hypothetical protein